MSSLRKAILRYFEDLLCNICPFSLLFLSIYEQRYWRKWPQIFHISQINENINTKLVLMKTPSGGAKWSNWFVNSHSTEGPSLKVTRELHLAYTIPVSSDLTS